MKIGFIGLGQMGAGMAANLLKAGHEVAVYNRTASKAEALVRLGAQAQRSVEAVCAADAVITMLSDDDALERHRFRQGRRAGQPQEGSRAHFIEHHQRGVVQAPRRRPRSSGAALSGRPGVWPPGCRGERQAIRGGGRSRRAGRDVYAAVSASWGQELS